MPTILVPVDGSDHALKALHIACDLAEKYGGRIALLHVLFEGRKAADLLKLKIAETFDANVKAALQVASRSSRSVPKNLLGAIGVKVLNQASGRVRRRGLEADILAMAVGAPAETILLAQKQTGASTIVMGCRGVSEKTGSSFGSVSNAVFARAACTCLSVK